MMVALVAAAMVVALSSVQLEVMAVSEGAAVGREAEAKAGREAKAAASRQVATTALALRNVGLAE